MYEDIREILKQVWPEWEIVEKIGEGSFGTVYKVVRQDIVGTSYAAVKVSVIPRDSNEAEALRAEGLTELETSEYYQQAVRDYTKEIQMMASVKGYTNIVAIEDYKVFKPEGRMIWYIFIRMELLTPLLKVVATGEMSEREIIRLGTDLCSALDICRQNRIIHRDIKPENIFVNSHGDYKLGDFGVARNLEKLTNGLSRKGTPNYMAPEVYKSSLEETDFTAASRVDIYSLGMVLYWLGNGSRLPFLPKDKQIPTPMDRKAAISRRVNGEPLPPPAKVSPALQRIILKACAYQPEERYASAAEMRAELAALAAGTQASGSGPSGSPRPAPPPSDKPHDHDSVPSAGGGSQKRADPEETVAVNRSLSDNPPPSGSGTGKTQHPERKKSFVPLLILIAVLGGLGYFFLGGQNGKENKTNPGKENHTVTETADKDTTREGSSSNTADGNSPQIPSSKSVSTSASASKKTQNQYFANGKLKTEYIFNSSGQVQRKNTYNRYGYITQYEVSEQFDQNGNIILSTVYNPNSTGKYKMRHYEYTYSSDGEIVRQEYSYADGTPGGVTEYDRDDQGHIVQLTHYDQNGNIDYININYKYDTANHVIAYQRLKPTIEQDSVQWAAESKTEQKWTNDIRVYSKSVYENGDIDESRYDPVYGDTVSSQTTRGTTRTNSTYTYNKSDYQQEYISKGDYYQRTISLYSADGRQLESRSYNEQGSMTSKFEYDEKGRISKYITYDENEKMDSYSLYEYDSQDRELKKTRYRLNGSIDWITYHQYQSDGTSQSKTIYYKEDGSYWFESDWK